MKQPQNEELKEIYHQFFKLNELLKAQPSLTELKNALFKPITASLLAINSIDGKLQVKDGDKAPEKLNDETALVISHIESASLDDVNGEVVKQLNGIKIQLQYSLQKYNAVGNVPHK